MSIGQKLQWLLLKDNRLTYRIRPSDVFQNIVESSEIKRVVHLCNHSSLDFKILDLSVNDFVKYATSILNKEFFFSKQQTKYFIIFTKIHHLMILHFYTKE